MQEKYCGTKGNLLHPIITISLTGENFCNQLEKSNPFDLRARAVLCLFSYLITVKFLQEHFPTSAAALTCMQCPPPTGSVAELNPHLQRHRHALTHQDPPPHPHRPVPHRRRR